MRLIAKLNAEIHRVMSKLRSRFAKATAETAQDAWLASKDYAIWSSLSVGSTTPTVISNLLCHAGRAKGGQEK